MPVVSSKETVLMAVGNVKSFVSQGKG